MNPRNINLGNIKEWLRHDWEKGIFMVVFTIAAIAVIFAVREINRWKVEATPVPPVTLAPCTPSILFLVESGKPTQTAVDKRGV